MPFKSWLVQVMLLVHLFTNALSTTISQATRHERFESLGRWTSSCRLWIEAPQSSNIHSAKMSMSKVLTSYHLLSCRSICRQIGCALISDKLLFFFSGDMLFLAIEEASADGRETSWKGLHDLSLVSSLCRQLLLSFHPYLLCAAQH